MNFKEFCKKYNLKLNPQQERAVLKTEGPSLMVAVPGSGKTTVIISRIAYMILCKDIPAEKILTLTFSTDAAKAMKESFSLKFEESLKGKAPEFRTIHSIALKIIREYCALKNIKPFKIIEKSSKPLKEILKSYGIPSNNESLLREVVNIISKNKNLMIYDSDFSISGIPLTAISEKYEQYKIINRLIDFDDILIYALRILENNPDILERLQNRYLYFNVDEAQDNSRIQNSIINILSSRDKNLFMVGDEDQCIYEFRGAYPESFFEFEKKWGSESIIKLETNYRSCDEILRVAGGFIYLNKNRYSKAMVGVKNRNGKVCIKNFSTYSERNAYILKDMCVYETSAILSRNNDSLISCAYALDKSSIPFRIKGGRNDFFDSFLLKDIRSILKASYNEDIYSIPKHLKIIIFDKKKLKRLKFLKPFDSIKYILEDLGYAKYLISRLSDGYSEQGYCTKLNIIQTIANDFIKNEDFLDCLERLEKKCFEGSDTGKISLYTCHGSKGLEFDKVYIVDVLDKVFPSQDTSAEASCYQSFYPEEEIRLFYVAMTRGREEVEILNVKTSYFGSSIPSIFVKDVNKLLK